MSRISSSSSARLRLAGFAATDASRRFSSLVSMPGMVAQPATHPLPTFSEPVVT